jgi:hypothetical protein
VKPSFAALLLCALTYLASAQVAVLHIQVIEGEGAVVPAGARSLHPMTVEVTDETGKPVAGAAVSFHLPEDGPGGAFANGLRTDVTITDARGRAYLHALQLNRTAGKLAIRIVASKEQARAGTMSFVYIADSVSTPSAPAARKSALKWVIVAALAGGAAAAGALLAGKSSAAPAAAAPAPVVTVSSSGVSIGSPSISVGKP